MLKLLLYETHGLYQTGTYARAGASPFGVAVRICQGMQIVPFARDKRCWNRVALHHLAYYPVREATNLGSQMVCNAIKAVADAYKVLKLSRQDEIPVISFRNTGAVHFDARTYRLIGETVSLYTLTGRTVIKMAIGDFQARYLAAGKPKEAKLVRKGKQWFFNLVLDIPETLAVNGDGVLGVDLGENNLASTSSGKIFGGGLLRHVRDRHLALRRRLQSNGSQSAKQLLKKVSGKVKTARHMRHLNHEASKAIVIEAAGRFDYCHGRTHSHPQANKSGKANALPSAPLGLA